LPLHLLLGVAEALGRADDCSVGIVVVGVGRRGGDVVSADVGPVLRNNNMATRLPCERRAAYAFKIQAFVIRILLI